MFINKRFDQDHPYVSVVVPVYNVQTFLPECLDSLISQSLKNIEIICVNDGSTDDSLTILRSYAEKDSRVKVLTKENRGYGHTMNLGFSAAKGEYIGICESDDFADKRMYEDMYRFAKKKNLDCLRRTITSTLSQATFFSAHLTNSNIVRFLILGFIKGLLLRCQLFGLHFIGEI